MNVTKSSCVFSNLLIHEGSHKVYREFQLSYDVFHRPGAKGCSDHRFRAHTLSLNCTIANSASTQSQQPVNRTWLIKSSQL